MRCTIAASLQISDEPTFFALYEKKEAQGTGFCSIRKGVHAFFGQRGSDYSHSSLVLPSCSECSCVLSVFSYCISKLPAGAVIVPFVGQLQNSPRIGERRDSWGVVSYPNVEKGAIRNRQARAHAPQRHRGRTRPYHLPWRSGGRHHRRP